MLTGTLLDLTPTPLPAYIYCHGGVDRELIANLIAIGYPVRGVILVADAESADVEDLPIVAEADALADLSQNLAVDVIVSACVGDDPVAAMAAYHAANAWAPQATRLLHPAATIPYFRVRYPGLFACVGFPGSGNVVTQAVLTQIQQHHGLSFDTGYEPFCARLARNQAYCTTGFIRDVLAPLGEFVHSGGHGHSERIGFRIEWPSGEFLSIEELPYCGYIGKNFAGHTIINERIKALLETFGYTWVRVVRDPISTIISNAAKRTRPPAASLNDQEWLSAISRWLAQYYAALDAVLPSAHTIRYEDLTKDPAASIVSLADAVKMPVDTGTAEAIWHEVGFKELTPAGPQHLYKPGQAKTGELSRAILTTMSEHGVADLTEWLGYAWPDIEALPCTNAPETWNTQSLLYGSTAMSQQECVSGLRCSANNPTLQADAARWLGAPSYSRYFGMLGSWEDQSSRMSIHP